MNNDIPRLVNHTTTNLLKVWLILRRHRRTLAVLWSILNHPGVREWVRTTLEWATTTLGLS